MPPLQPLLVLKKGLKILNDRAELQKNELLSRLQQGKTLTEEEEQWLDHGEGNNADGQVIVSLLEEAPDFEASVAKFDEAQILVMKRLREAGAGEAAKGLPGKKRKRMWLFDIHEIFIYTEIQVLQKSSRRS